MASWHGAQPNVLAPKSVMQSTSHVSPSAQWMPAQSSPDGGVPFQPFSSTAGMPLSKFPSFCGFLFPFLSLQGFIL